jgi:chemotaxis protein CheY-P-specific phosphatase CheC
LELSESDKNYLFPLFIESMNILTGKQITLDDEFSNFKIQMSPPKLSMIPREINSSLRIRTQKYDLEMDDISYKVLVDYNLQAAN